MIGKNPYRLQVDCFEENEFGAVSATTPDPAPPPWLESLTVGRLAVACRLLISLPELYPSEGPVVEVRTIDPQQCLAAAWLPQWLPHGS